MVKSCLLYKYSSVLCIRAPHSMLSEQLYRCTAVVYSRSIPFSLYFNTAAFCNAVLLCVLACLPAREKQSAANEICRRADTRKEEMQRQILCVGLNKRKQHVWPKATAVETNPQDALCGVARWFVTPFDSTGVAMRRCVAPPSIACPRRRRAVSLWHGQAGIGGQAICAVSVATRQPHNHFSASDLRLGA